MSLSVRGLKVMRGGFPIIDGVDLEIAQGEFAALTGPSGCGKSTLLNVVAGLFPAEAGEIRADRGSLGYVFQRPMLLPWRTVLDNATYGLECRGETKALARKRAGELLEKAGLGNFMGFFPHELSEGMKQRLNVARAFAVNPRLVLMDEPFSALDEAARRDLQSLVLSLWRKTGCTVVFVSHFLEELAFLADRVVILTDRPARVSRIVDISLERPRGEGTDGLFKLLQIAQLCR